MPASMKERVAAFLQGAGIGVGDGKGQEAPKHDGKVFHAVLQRPGSGGGLALAGEVQPDEGAALQSEDGSAQQPQQQADQELKPEGVAHTLGVGRAMELGRKNSGTGAGTENAQVEHENQAIDDGHAAHGDGAHLTDHDVVKQGYKIGDSVLDDNGNGNLENPPVEGTVANIL